MSVRRRFVGMRAAGAVLAAACAAAAPAFAGGATPARVMSLDHCADQYVLALAERAQIAALSPRATDSYAYHAGRARGLPQTAPTAENILMTRPDLVIRLWGGAPGTADLLARAGVATLDLPYATDFAATRANLRKAGAALGNRAKARRVIARMDRRLAKLRARRLPERARPEAVYLTPSGTTAGAGTFVHRVLVNAGLRNMGAARGRSGWYRLDLERLAMNPPEVVVVAAFAASMRMDFWAITRHSFMQRLFARVPVIRVPGRLLTCQAWYAVEAMARIQDRLAELPGMLRPARKAAAAGAR